MDDSRKKKNGGGVGGSPFLFLSLLRVKSWLDDDKVCPRGTLSAQAGPGGKTSRSVCDSVAKFTQRLQDGRRLVEGRPPRCPVGQRAAQPPVPLRATLGQGLCIRVPDARLGRAGDATDRHATYPR